MNKTIAVTLVFLGAISSVNAQSNARQTDNTLLASTASLYASNLNTPTVKTVSAIESVELSKQASERISRSLAAKLDKKLELQFTFSQ